MTLQRLIEHAADKQRFQTIEDYIEFARAFLDYAGGNLQAVIVSCNEPHYNFWQFKKEGSHNITRPINSNLMFHAAESDQFARHFTDLLGHIRAADSDTAAHRECLNRSIYTLQQCIGA